MDPNKSGSHGDYGVRPPPYSSSYPGGGYQVGPGNISVVSPPGPCANGAQAHFAGFAGHQQYSDAPPEYSEGSDNGAFDNRAVRRGFIRKVYLILTLQLLVTVGIICAFVYWDALRDWTEEHYWFTYCMMAATVVLILLLSCCDNLRRQVPFNFLALGLFTVVEGLMLGSVTIFFNAEAVMWAVGATAMVSFGLTLFAVQSKWDFTTAYGSLWVFGWTLLSFALLCAILRSQYLSIVYACLGTLLFSLYLVFDTQLILGGKNRKYQVSPEEYVFAALSLYLDVVTLFLLLLQLIGLCR
ncbi:protein lifeguard 1 [Takifugu flavidus]|uniref:protein lifeguard 1 n=1 Tax=Takifugu flavidus TaxID=433684 RepID=UPI00254455DD|nr:protein lifeguard 1 [Takifugu flavidus]XP_056902403.1 protein lifeguard 1 [Takifugu flavidus]